MRDPFNAWCYQFDIYPHSFFAAGNCSSEIAAMGDGKMVFLSWQVGLSGISDHDLGKREIIEQFQQQVAAGQVLQAFIGMGNIFFQRNALQEKFFRFLYAPNSQPGGMVDIMLIK